MNLVLITYPHGKPCIAETKPWDDGDLWIRGHGAARQLVEQQRCTIVPLVAMTQERIEALETLLDNGVPLDSLDKWQYEAYHNAARTLRAMLDDLEDADNE